MNYFIAEGNQRRGPFPAEQLPVQGLRPESLVWREGMADWQRADSLPELAAMFPQQAPPPPQYAQPSGFQQPPYVPQYGMPGPTLADASSKKIAAGICALLIGSLGIHKFVLGMTTSGVIMLLVTLIGGILTCGVASMAMTIIAIIEGIMYLTKSDQEFYQLYMVEKKQWF